MGLDFFSGTGSDTRRSTCCDPTRTRIRHRDASCTHRTRGTGSRAQAGVNDDLLLAFGAVLGHSATEAEHQVEGRLLLDVVVGEGAAVLELLAREDETLLIGGDALLVLDLRLDHVDGVRRLHLKGDGLARESLDEDLPPPPNPVRLGPRICGHTREASARGSAAAQNADQRAWQAHRAPPPGPTGRAIHCGGWRRCVAADARHNLSRAARPVGSCAIPGQYAARPAGPPRDGPTGRAAYAPAAVAPRDGLHTARELRRNRRDARRGGCVGRHASPPPSTVRWSVYLHTVATLCFKKVSLPLFLPSFPAKILKKGTRRLPPQRNPCEGEGRSELAEGVRGAGGDGGDHLHHARDRRHVGRRQALQLRRPCRRQGSEIR